MTAAERGRTPAEVAAHGTEGARHDGGHVEGARVEGADEALLKLVKISLSATIRAGSAAQPSLSPTQVRTLSVIAGAAEGLSVHAVAEAISASNPSASRLCHRLVRDGLLDRAAGPGNELRMSLSPHGHRTLDAVNAHRVAELRSLLDALTPTGRRRVSAALRELTDQL